MIMLITCIIGSSKADITGSNIGFFPEAGTIMLSWIPISSSNKETPSLTAGGGERSTETKEGISKKLLSSNFLECQKMFSEQHPLRAQSVLQRAVSLPNRSDTYEIYANKS